MSLATRCPTCGTVFRVVQDQLKVSEGWVRCGRCSEVFSALEGLFDLDRQGPSEAAPVPSLAGEMVDITEGVHDDAATRAELPPPDAPAPASSVPTMLQHSEAASLESPRSGAPADSDGLNAAPTEAGPAPTGQAGSEGMARPEEPSLPPDDVGLAHATGPDTDTDSDPDFDPDPDPDEPAPGVAATSEFAGYSGYRRRTRTGPARTFLAAAACVVLALGFGLQLVFHHRSQLTARFPVAQWPMESFCGLVGCTIDPATRLEDLYVESTSLTRHLLPDSFLLSVILRSRADFPLALPAVELSLTGADGELIARKILLASDFKTSVTRIAPKGEIPLATVITGGGKVSGYTVEIFYP